MRCTNENATGATLSSKSLRARAPRRVLKRATRNNGVFTPRAAGEMPKLKGVHVASVRCIPLDFTVYDLLVPLSLSCIAKKLGSTIRRRTRRAS